MIIECLANLIKENENTDLLKNLQNITHIEFDGTDLSTSEDE